MSIVKRPALIFLLITVVSLPGCSGLQPVSPAQEYSLEPSQATLWKALEQQDPGDWFVFLNAGPEALDLRLLAIDSATESIDIQTFLWSNDTAGTLVLDHLVTAADRGVRVRILIDDTFILSEDEALLALQQEHPNIEYRVYNPFKRRTSGFFSRQLLNLGEFQRLDHRMHNKALIVDNRVAIVGGRNIADEYFGLHPVANFRDMELLAGGPVVREIGGAFDNYWNDPWCFSIDGISHLSPSTVKLEAMLDPEDKDIHIHAEEAESARKARWLSLQSMAFNGKAKLYVDEPPVANPATRGHSYGAVGKELLALFNAAQHDVLVISAYLIPSRELEQAVQQAVARGVEVRILTNSIRSNNHLTAHAAYRNHMDELLQHGAALHEVRIDARDRHLYMLRPVAEKALALHAKALVIDHDRVFIGSANLDPRSLKINTEMGLLVESKELNAHVREVIERDYALANSWHVRLDGEGGIIWVADHKTLTEQPADSFMQRIEDWFFAILPVEEEM